MNNSITESDVKKWKATLEAQKKQVSGYNSFIPSKPYEEFQIDLLFFTKEGEAEPRAEVKKIDEEAAEANQTLCRKISTYQGSSWLTPSANTAS